MLEVAGRGPLEPALREFARELGIEDAVRFLGFVSPVQAAIEDAAIVVVPSLGEGFGMVALEAMERARPVIASAVGGLPEIVADGETGLVVPPADPDALAEAAMGESGRDRALSMFTPERCVERIEELYARA
jgi:glycosyltransferase involved in cell wall biosynthesis